ncbi:hypothetical protein HK105_202084 [Polyrhizophydium stewartii]|uniref:Calnexin n=1 Tax=Polyrhizophydium stewartii TaxID=2732419 RepID=A0ABR4NF50_9FUNG|nr:hypothetical protein HK105_006392 [Polyrhizophydium stewartii]
MRFALAATLATAALVAADAPAAADANAAPKPDASGPVFKATAIKAPFLEQFVDGWGSTWIPSTAKKVVDGVEDEELLRYRGKWDVEASTPAVIVGDKGLVVKTAAALHAISAKLPKVIDPKGKPLIVQYEVKLQNGLECGGAYIKLLTHTDSFEPTSFGESTPYTIMFGPDKCGGNNRVHFIFRHKNPVNGKIEEKHLAAPPAAIIDNKTNLYTLIVRPDQTYEILINNESASSGSLLENFTPPVNPPAEIDDPTDSKPADWVDVAKIPDPKATKPDDWDESAPLEIPDEDAKQPSDWLPNEQAFIPDPKAEKPEDWDDEEDGEWTAPTVPNPKCEAVSGCGEWVRPNKPNPAYKGKWRAPLIDNPEYKGEWAPRKIPNPDYFEDKTPSDFTKIGGLGIELWTMQNGIMFDNIYIGHSADDAKKLADETWAVKASIEKAQEPEPAKEDEKAKGPGAAGRITQAVQTVKDQTLEFVDRVQQDPLAAIKELPHIAALLAVVAVLPIFLIASFVTKKTTVEEPEEDGDDEDEKEKKEDKPAATPSKKDTKAKAKATPKKD